MVTEPKIVEALEAIIAVEKANAEMMKLQNQHITLIMDQLLIVTKLVEVLSEAVLRQQQGTKRNQ